jgi:hypothetical protein
LGRENNQRSGDVVSSKLTEDKLSGDEIDHIRIETPEGNLAGKISQLLSLGAANPGLERPTFLRACALIREYGDQRVKDARNAN